MNNSVSLFISINPDIHKYNIDLVFFVDKKNDLFQPSNYPLYGIILKSIFGFRKKRG